MLLDNNQLSEIQGGSFRSFISYLREIIYSINELYMYKTNEECHCKVRIIFK